MSRHQQEQTTALRQNSAMACAGFADRVVVWASHCHVLDHVTGPNGEMTGLMTVVKVLPW